MDALSAKLSDLNLSPIAYKLTMASDGPRWTAERAREAIRWYKNFLYLAMKYPTKSVVPTHDIDEVWHCHILDTQKYMDDCDYLFGKYMHHFPYLGLRGRADEHLLATLFSETLALFKSEFGDMPRSSDLSAVCANGCRNGFPVAGNDFDLRPSVDLFASAK